MIRVMKIVTDEVKIDEILHRGVHEIFTREELKKQLLSGRKLHFKLGTDVTGANLHLGHAVLHRKLRDFQELIYPAIPTLSSPLPELFFW